MKCLSFRIIKKIGGGTKIVFVGFNIKQSKAVLYQKLELNSSQDEENIKEKIGAVIRKSFMKGCNFVSVRFIESEE